MIKAHEIQTDLIVKEAGGEKIDVGLIMLVIIGIRFILKSDKEKPDFKNVAMNYIFGAICIFGATTILTFIQKIAIQFKNAV